MKIVLISIADWSLKYLDETIDKKKLADTVLITNKVTNKLKKYTNLNKVKVIKTQKISKKTFKGINVSKSLILSAGSPWIFNKSLIKHLGKNFFNVHQSPLPSMRGSVASYVILYDIRAFQSCIHKVNTGIDTGNIVYRKSFLIPSSARTPLEVNNFLQNKNRIMVKEFIKKFTKMEKIYDEKQNYFFSSYNKRLSSKINGWIDWSLDVDDLDRFIRAFDNPYNGAQTFIGNIRVSIKNIEKSKNEGARHPEEIGKVLRKFEEYVVVSVLNGTLYIREILKNNKNIINKIKAGDKLYTKKKFIDLKNQRAIFVKNRFIYNTKTTLKKI